MGLTNIAEYCAKYAQVYGKRTVRIIETGVNTRANKGVNLSKELRYFPLKEDTVHFSEKILRRPSAEKLELLLKEQGIENHILCVKEPYISDNNSLFLEELIKRFPKKEGEKTNKTVQNIMMYLEDIDHSAYPNKKEFLEKFLADIKEVEKMVDKDGKYLYWDVASHKSTTSIYTTRAILQAKYNNPERYKEIMDLYQLQRDGRVPKYLIQVLYPEAHFHALPKSDIQKLIRGENYYPKFEKLSEDTISKLETGEAFSVGKDMYVKTTHGYEKLKIDVDTYEKLFPPVERYAIAQGPLGNCHLMAALDSLTKNPEGRIELYRLFENVTVNGKKGVKCTVSEFKDKGVIYDFDNLPNLYGENNLKGSLGHKIIEYTYSSGRYDYLLNSPNVSSYIRDYQVRRINGDIVKINDYAGDSESVIDHIQRLVGLNAEYRTSFPPEVKQEILGKQKGISVIDCSTEMPKKGLIHSHFYNGGDLSQNTIINPHNSLEEIPHSPFELQAVTYVI